MRVDRAEHVYISAAYGYAYRIYHAMPPDERVRFLAPKTNRKANENKSFEVLFRGPCHAGPAKVRAATCGEVFFFHAPSPEEGARGLQVPLWGPGSLRAVAGGAPAWRWGLSPSNTFKGR